MAKEMRAAAGADIANVANGVESDDPAFCADGLFGSLLRDLRALAGTEALLATADEIPTVRGAGGWSTTRKPGCCAN